MPDSNIPLREDEIENFSKWQERTLQLRTSNINLFLGITLASIGFIVGQVLDKDFEFSNCYSKVLLSVGSLFLLTTSFVFLLTTLTRLRSFRLTTKIVRKKNKNELIGIEELRDKVIALDERTIIQFNWSIYLFAIGEFAAIAGFTAQVINKL